MATRLVASRPRSHDHATVPRARRSHDGAVIEPLTVSAATSVVPVATIEDDDRYRAGLEILLRHAPDFSLAGSFRSADDALAEIESHAARGDAVPWRLVLMDLGLPGMSGIECTRRLKAALPDVTVVVLTVFEDRSSIVEAICAGADGYLLKRTPGDKMLVQLRSVLAGGSPLSAGVARTVLDIVRHLEPVTGGRGRAPDDPASSLTLTDREQQVLRCLVRGESYKTAARELDISLDTVRSHIRHIYRKLQVHSVAEAVSRALREGLV